MTLILTMKKWANDIAICQR